MNQEIDNQLLLDVLNGNEKSKKIFIDLCMQCIWGALKRFDQLVYEDKEDLVSNILFKEIFGTEGDWVGIRKYRGDSKFTTYLYGIVTFRALDFLKSKGIKYKSKTESIENSYGLHDKQIDIESQMSLESSFSVLTDKEKNIVDLASKGYKHREIADKFDVSINNISSILSRAYKKMKKYMQEN
tara:strand:- start:14 stop:565 length:552 start_codon:yes stop_codon:yes gene_type:complete